MSALPWTVSTQVGAKVPPQGLPRCTSTTRQWPESCGFHCGAMRAAVRPAEDALSPRAPGMGVRSPSARKGWVWRWRCTSACSRRMLLAWQAPVNPLSPCCFWHQSPIASRWALSTCRIRLGPGRGRRKARGGVWCAAPPGIHTPYPPPLGKGGTRAERGTRGAEPCPNSCIRLQDRPSVGPPSKPIPTPCQNATPKTFGNDVQILVGDDARHLHDDLAGGGWRAGIFFPVGGGGRGWG